MTAGRRQLSDLAGATAATLLLLASSLLVPVAGAVAGIFAGAPLAWLAARRGPLPALAGAAIAAAALLAARVAPPAVGWLAVWQTLPACFVGWRLGRGRGLFGSCAAAAAAVAAATVVRLLLWSGETGREPFAFFEDRIRVAWDALAKASAGAGGEASLGLGAEDLERALAVQRRTWPSQLLQAAFLLAAVNALAALRALARTDPGRIPPPAFRDFRLPEPLIWAAILAIALAWAPGDAGVLGTNASLALLGAYLLQGLSVLANLLARAGTSRLGLGLLGAAVVIQPWLLAAPLLLGLLDFRFDFRARIARPPSAT